MAMVSPPSLLGAPNVTDNCPSDAVTVPRLGAVARVAGVTETAEVAELSPTELTARSLTLYVVPLVKPTIRSGERVEPADCHVKPPFVEYSTLVIGDPPLAPSSNSR